MQQQPNMNGGMGAGANSAAAVQEEEQADLMGGGPEEGENYYEAMV